MNSEFRRMADDIRDTLTDNACHYLMIIKGEEETVVSVNADTIDLLWMLHKLYKDTAVLLTERHGEELAEEFMKTIPMTDDEIEAENKRIMQKCQKKTIDIPAWLKRLMKIEDKAEDTESDDLWAELFRDANIGEGDD